MPPQSFKYTFHDSVEMPDVEAAFVLATLATESVHGQSQTRLFVEHTMEVEKRKCLIDCSTSIGLTLNKLFVGFLQREFEDDAFKVERIRTMQKCTATGGTT